jgi:sigma-B regulation protein RsbU (phosphoserine phosphatase)
MTLQRLFGENDMTQTADILTMFTRDRPWQERLAYVMDMMRDMSSQNDPQKVVALYGQRIRKLIPMDRTMSLSRRNLAAPKFRITRSDLMDRSINPWKTPEKLPVLEGGLIGKLMYGEETVIIDDLQIDPDDPAAPYLDGVRSLVAIPLFEGGLSINMIVAMRFVPNGFSRESLPEQVWMSNLFGRATATLRLTEELTEAYAQVDRELQSVAQIQRSLLPAELPTVRGLSMAVHYQTSRRAGGDYYDFFPLPEGQWGLFIGDVSGHGTPAAVIMAVTHSIAHTLPEQPCPASRLLDFVNTNLCARYTNGNGTFVTAIYAIFDPDDQTLRYSSAGHCSPRLRRGNRIISLDEARNIPLGIDASEPYTDAKLPLYPGDVLVFYTDGITEARKADGDLFGIDRLDEAVLAAKGAAGDFVETILSRVRAFTEGNLPVDDETLLVVQVSQSR